MPDSNPRGLGLRPVDDPRDANFLLSARLPERTKPLPTKPKHWAQFFRPLDQLLTGTCVGHGGKHVLMTGPMIQTTPKGKPTAIDLCLRCCAIDEFPENDDGNLYYGTSLHALFRVFVELGYCTEYRWAQSLSDIQQWLSFEGPMMFATAWYSDMDDPDFDGTLHVGGELRGYHLYAVTGIDNPRRRVRITNSWGPDWGDGGRAWMSFEDAERLIFADRYGRAGVAIETRAARIVTGRLRTWVRRIFPW